MGQVASSYGKLFQVDGLTQPSAQLAGAAQEPDPAWLTQYFAAARASESEQESVRPAVALARMLSNSPLCQADEQEVATQLAESLAIPEPRMTRIVAEPSTVNQSVEGQPQFQLIPESDCSVVVQMDGLLKVVTLIELRDKAGAFVAKTEHDPLPYATEYVWTIALSVDLAPYLLLIGGGEDDLDEMDFDIKCPD